MEEITIMHYGSSHKILLVGEGDFSFSLCLARAFGTARNMVATSLDSRAHPFSDWDIKKLAQDEGLFSSGEVPFYQHLFPGYNNKRGAGSRCDESFPVGRSSTFKFTKQYSIFSLYYDQI
ncbi:hypothetical protein SESBI_45187 [Sesbania bispinosa]|nr:hypothetical protein SESBI_45187 [Sesbania bispinosa]